MACILSIIALLSATHAYAIPHPQPDTYQPSTYQTQTYEMPLTHNPFGFLSNISIGTPPQQLTVFVDWTWIGQYVLTPRCHGSLSNSAACFQPGQQLFYQNASSTFKNASNYAPERTWNPNHFFFYQDLTVQSAYEVETVGPSKTEIMIQAADFQFPQPSPFPFAGVYGLSPVFPSDNTSTQSPYYQALQKGAWPSPQFSFHYCYPGAPTGTSSCNGADGLQTLGGYNESLIANDSLVWYDNIFFPEVNIDDFVYSPAVYNYWAMNLTRFAIGDEDQPLNISAGGSAGAIFDHASYGRGAPMSVNAYNKLVGMANGTPITLSMDAAPNNGNQSFYSVDCGVKNTLPPLKYEFNSVPRTWEIEAKSYVWDFGNGTCVLNIRTLGYGDMITGNFGETFSQDKYILFDFEKLQVGVADLAW